MQLWAHSWAHTPCSHAAHAGTVRNHAPVLKLQHSCITCMSFQPCLGSSKYYYRYRYNPEFQKHVLGSRIYRYGRSGFARINGGIRIPAPEIRIPQHPTDPRRSRKRVSSCAPFTNLRSRAQLCRRSAAHRYWRNLSSASDRRVCDLRRTHGWNLG